MVTTLYAPSLRNSPRVSQAAARYTPAGGLEKCGSCRHFVTQGACTRVLGSISPRGWCKFFAREMVWHGGGVVGSGSSIPTDTSLDISFLSAPLDPRITFTRGSVATYFDSTGTMQTAAANVPRFDSDPVTHAPLGLLIEEARTNSALQSGNFGTAPWSGISANGPAAPIITTNQVVAPDGTTTAARIVLPAVTGATGAGGQTSSVYQPVSPIASAYAWSVYLRGSVGGEQVYLFVTGNTGPVPVGNVRVTLTTAWQRFSVVTSVLTSGVNCFPQIGADLRDVTQAPIAAQTIYAWGGQLEAGAFSTSYIATAAASIARAPDVAAISTAAWYAAGSGSFAADTVSLSATTPNNPTIVELDDGTAANRIVLYAPSGAVQPYMNVAGTTAFNGPSIGSIVAGSLFKAGIAYQAGSQFATMNGSAGQSFANASVPATINALKIGGNQTGGSNYSGWMRRIRYWQRKLSNSELQQVTT